jgi:carbohydrate-selective porin OprB
LAADAAFANEAPGEFGPIDVATAAAPGAEPSAKRKANGVTRGKAKGKSVAASASGGPAASAPWGPVPSDSHSLVNRAPGLVVYFNDGPVFGLPGTVTGDIAERTQLLGDWGGARTELARKGFFVDLYSTSYYQNIVWGGLETGGAFVQNTQVSVNIDTGRAGRWSNGLIHVTAQSRVGDDPNETFTAGSVVPQYSGLVLPDPLAYDSIMPTEYFLAQTFSRRFRVVAGKIGTVLLPDQTAFGDSFKYHFANFSFNKNAITANFFNPSALGALAAWTVTPHLSVAGGVLDPNTKVDRLVDAETFSSVNIYLTAMISYELGGLPGVVSPVYNWSNKPRTNLDAPFGALASSAERSQAIDSLLGLASSEGLPTNLQDESWFAVAIVSQYLFLKDDAATVARKQRTGEPIRGVGLYARAGYAPEETNPITSDVSVALFARGILDSRENDSFGVGFYHDRISDKLKNSLAVLSEGNAVANDESGMEVFYNLAITPAVRLIPSYQHIWHPLAAEVAEGQDGADIVQVRLTTAW